MDQGAMNYVVRVLVQRILALILFWLGARSELSWHVWIYFGTIFAISIAASVIMLRVNPETLSQRGKVVTDSPLWDKVLLGSYWILHFFAIHWVAGREWQGSVPSPTLYWIGMILVVLSSLLAVSALAVNPFLESTSRIQAERGQSVIATGVYGVVRHPTYAAVLLSALGIALVFSTTLVAVTAGVISAIIVLRTYLEDRMLRAHLAGYLEYAQKVRYRLLPYVW